MNESQLNPLDFLNPRSIDAARQVCCICDGASLIRIARIIDNHTDRFPDAADKWLPASEVSEQEWWWWWNGDEDSCPVPVNIARDSGGRFFATEGQLGWNRFQFVDDMGGLWRKIIEPPVPHHVGR
jgi:hypothetical protein